MHCMEIDGKLPLRWDFILLCIRIDNVKYQNWFYVLILCEGEVHVEFVWRTGCRF
jgi:hypothetical protein